MLDSIALHATTCDDQAKDLLEQFSAILATEESALRSFRHRELEELTERKIEVEAKLAAFVAWLQQHPESLSPAMRTLWRQQAATLRQQGERNLMRMQHSMSLLQGLTQRLMGATTHTYTARRQMAYTQAPKPVLTNSIG